MGTIIDSIVDSIHMVNTIFVGIGWLFFIVMWVLFDFIKAVGYMITLYIYYSYYYVLPLQLFFIYPSRY
ncbi:hypothetical protein 015DV004_12 [Bacillus phage 015DV004]|nr:hypothetical protein 015DV004_12 [Bacillus phage 015DV004]